MMVKRGISDSMAWLLGLVFLAALGCAGATEPPTGVDGGGDTAVPDGGTPRDGQPPPDGDARPPEPAPTAHLHLHLLDIWGQPLPLDELRYSLTVEGGALLMDERSAILPVDLRDSERFTLEVSVPDHDPFRVDLEFDGSATEDGMRVSHTFDSVGHGVSLATDWEEGLDGVRIPHHHLYVGLRHSWFSAQGSPARRGNQIELLLDGEDGWARVRDDVISSRSSIHMSTWWWNSEFELYRDPDTHVVSSTRDRWRYTVMGTFEAAAATKRLLVGQFWSMDGFLSGVNIDDRLEAHALAPDDRFEYMGQYNPSRGEFSFMVDEFNYADRIRALFPHTDTLSFAAETPIESTVPPREIDLTDFPLGLDIPHASYHQKFMVIDSQIAYVGGMNLHETDWDTSEHRVFEPRRMHFDASSTARRAVAMGEQLPDEGPRKDYSTRIVGPIVQDVDALFAERWDYLRETGARYFEHTSEFEPARDLAPLPGGVQAQITITMPEPFWRHSIAESWFNAVSQAEDYILIEDQYFRIPMLLDVILARMAEEPALQLVVVTNNVNRITDIGCEWTSRTVEEVQAAFPTRFHLFQLRSFDTIETWGFDETEERFADIDIHSKMLIIDDRFLSVGSANKNNRGIVFEAEMNVAILDDAWVREARIAVLRSMLPAGTTPEELSRDWIEQLRSAASWNGFVLENWDAAGGNISLDGRPLPEAYRPLGFLYPLDFVSPSRCVLNAGPDVS